MHARRLLATAAGTTALLLLPLAGPAVAHVTVQGPGATQGGYTKLTFRAPTEKDVATTKLEIAMPTDAPIASIRVKPKPGWTYELVTAAPAAPLEVHGQPVTEVVTRVVWTANGPGIGATEFDEFEVSAGPLPEVERLVFKALQTYADGEVVRWIEEPVDGGEEPEKPAPVLELAAADEAENDTVAVENAATSAPAEEGTSALSVAALAVGVVALLVAGYAVVRRRA